MKKWLGRFWNRHGDRMIFGGIACGMAVGMWQYDGLRGSAQTILIGLAMLCFNKARGTEEGGKE